MGGGIGTDTANNWQALLAQLEVGNGIELDRAGCHFEPYWWRPCGVTWDVVPEQSW